MKKSSRSAWTFAVAVATSALTVAFSHPLAAQNAPAATSTVPVREAATPGQDAPVPLSTGAADVLKLARAKVGENTIVAFVGNSGKPYNLGAAEIIYLREQGISDRVITSMLEQGTKLPQTHDASLTGTAAASGQSSVAYVQPPTAYVPPSTVYVVPSPEPAYIYRDYYPYYRPYFYPGISLSFGFGGFRHGGGLRVSHR